MKCIFIQVDIVMKETEEHWLLYSARDASLTSGSHDLDTLNSYSLLYPADFLPKSHMGPS